ncbi:hypothetical protein [Enterobacter asburiae]|jgi:hypothetical protein|uniref:hypothetical protein n=1 Tax=Enterobacter asburiae TaxID=61645 RepID=UPI002075F481|nr:hypothetical protein [Enterobacter asburiae]MCM7835171.1 hypothetical protein [Enterobacter asburiae]
MIKQLLGISDEKRMAEALVRVYFEDSGFEAEALEDGRDMGDWLGLGDKLMVSEIKSFKSKTGDFTFRFLTTDGDNNLVKNQAMLNIKKTEDGYVFSVADLKQDVKGESDIQSLKEVIALAKRFSETF